MIEVEQNNKRKDKEPCKTVTQVEKVLQADLDAAVIEKEIEAQDIKAFNKKEHQGVLGADFTNASRIRTLDFSRELDEIGADLGCDEVIKIPTGEFVAREYMRVKQDHENKRVFNLVGEGERP